MPQIERSPIRVFGEAIKESSVIKSAGIKVYIGDENLAKTSAPRRIVLVPATGQLVFPQTDRRRNSAAPPLCDCSLQIFAYVWSGSAGVDPIDEAWEMQRRYIQAANANTVAGGCLYTHEATVWGQTPDTGLQGQALTVILRLVLPVERIADVTATIDTVEATTLIVNPATGVEQAGPTITIT